MRIAVISDTHLERPTAWFEAFYEAELAPMDLLLHCGDYAAPAMYHYLLQHPGFHGVLGNSDPWTMHGELPWRATVQAGDLVLGLAHGHAELAGDPARVLDAFGGGVDVVCFGHTHRFLCQTMRGVLVVNPGSLCASRSGRRSYAVLTKTGKRMHVDERRLPGDCWGEAEYP
ncbi:metallophosphoesterase family protein [Megalodesulfovibrio gigas]|uniref:Phosphoesterase n=1 Tax=Megalodesulfovibrio gigas (strain ATCC 19364 / DSM 1382 / NCIMB 9332 / VKM B-1759) TaxID=1121448 RepID=T2G8Y3_MEGG1|nr:metallophosphoesterase family protein [Megalodesulfovibrio gigas]AGW12377.1 putative phosphodiesterase, MJ0936 family [Megalodesulfovibrio gigas DSM 1382 = ATCC 19364]